VVYQQGRSRRGRGTKGWQQKEQGKTRLTLACQITTGERVNVTPEYIKDTIVAAATPPGAGGIGIVRVSGPATEEITRRIAGRLPRPRYATNTSFRNAAGEEIDAGIAIYFPAPHSFTGESVLEMQGHGGPLVLASLVEAAIACGARRADAGEFSKRAFLNGKLDLAQAEAIADLIGSGTEQAARAALRTLSGAFSRAVDTLQERLIRLRLHVEAAIDFPEEEIDFLDDRTLQQQIEQCEQAFASLQKEARIGRVLRDGLQVVILGKPNVGKSSLLNLLSGQEAAIVTEIAGTTRDILREQINIDGLLVELVDTAGLRENPDVIEAEGIRRAREAQKNADAILWIKDANDADDETVETGAVPCIILRNKTDLSNDPPGLVSETPPVINISAKTGAGIDELRTAIRRVAGYRDLGEGAFTARRRHVDALQRAYRHFASGRTALQEDRAGEILADELRLAHEQLGEITGAFSSDDLLGRIFSEFCIGK
jgi:tRNA modification GTPase